MGRHSRGRGALPEAATTGDSGSTGNDDRPGNPVHTRLCAHTYGATWALIVALLVAVVAVGGAYVFRHLDTRAGLLVLLGSFSAIGWAGGVVWKGRDS